MRKINMKRKTSKKEKAEQKKTEGENGVEEKSDPKNSGDEEPVSNEEESTENEPEPKKKKTDKRKSADAKKKSSPKKSAGQEKEKAAESDDEEDDAQYEVQEVIDEKMIRGVRHFLIRWKGYESESDTWEPESTLQCADLIKKFKASREESGKENSDVSKKSKKDDKKIKKKEKKDKKSSSKPDDNVDWDSNDEFEVDRIIDVYFRRNGKREFLVSWKGYPSSQDSWEPEENLDCHDLIARFMTKVDAAKNVEQKELRVHRTPTERFTLSTNDGGRRLSRRHSGKQRVQYHDAE